MRFWNNPQERELRPINEAVTDAQQIVLNRIVHATHISTDQCPIPIVAYAGESDNVVTPVSAKGNFPDTGIIPGNHFTIIQPDSLKHRAYTTLKANLLAVLTTSEIPAEGKKSIDEQAQKKSQPQQPITSRVDAMDLTAESQTSVSNIEPDTLHATPSYDAEDSRVVVRWNPTLRTVEFLLSPETARSWLREFEEESKESD
jgi:hypothetical protein